MSSEDQLVVRPSQDQVVVLGGGSASSSPAARALDSRRASYISKTVSERTLLREAGIEEGGEETQLLQEDEGDGAGPKVVGDSSSQYSGPKSRPGSDSSENNCMLETAIPCCRKRKAVCPKTCPSGTVRVCCDPCCCNPCVTTAVADNVKLKEENKILKRCIKRVRACAVSDACEIIKGVLDDYKCSCCQARKELRPCKSVTTVPCRETCLCVPLPGSQITGGYTPSGWGRLLKKCRELSTTESCGPCDFAAGVSPIVNLRCKCLPRPCPCPPCPHLCPLRCLPPALRPYTPCCPLYFPAGVCCPGTSTPVPCCSGQTDKSSVSGSSCCCKSAAMAAPAYRPKYTRVSAICEAVPQTSASVPGAFPKMEAHMKEETAAAGKSYSPVHSPTRKDSPTYGGSYSR